MHHASSHITLAKGQHRESTVIWLQFSGRRDWLELIKGLGCIQYSRTHSTWYIPYDKVAYHHFKQLALKYNIPVILSGTHAVGHQASEGEPALSHDRVVNMSANSKEVLEQYFERYKPAVYLFESQIPRKAYSASSISSILRQAAAKANISKKVTPHVMRHSFATHQIDMGIAVPKVQELLGHKDIRTTMICTHLNTDNIQAVGNRLDKILQKVSSDIKKV